MDYRQGFPLLYNGHQGSYQKDLPFWFDLAKESPHPVLELGCGTGRISLQLAKRGIKVIGLDIDLAMLQYLQARIDNLRLPGIFIYQSDMSSFHLKMEFGTIISPCNTLSTLSTQLREKTIQCAYQHLRPEGIFSASVPNPEHLRKLPESSEPEIEDIFYHPHDHNPVQVLSCWLQQDNNLIVTWHYDHLQPNGFVDRTTINATYNLDPVGVYQENLINSGFESISYFGDFDFSPYNSESEFLVIIARKTPKN